MSGTALIYMEFQDLKLKYSLSASHLTSVNSQPKNHTGYIHNSMGHTQLYRLMLMMFWMNTLPSSSGLNEEDSSYVKVMWVRLLLNYIRNFRDMWPIRTKGSMRG